MCSVGDLKNNLKILQTEARQMKYSGDFNLDGLTRGNPHALLPLYNYIFTSYNAQFYSEVLDMLDDSLYLKSDVRFIEAVYRILRDMFHFKPTMTKEQFFTMNNFAERKIMMCVEVMRLIQNYCRFMGPKNPTNPNIKVSSVVDTRRCMKKSSTELVTGERSPDSDISLTRKVSGKLHTKTRSSQIRVKDDGWQMKAGYLQPQGEDKGEGKAREDRREKSAKGEGVEKEAAGKKDKLHGADKPAGVATGVRDTAPSAGKARAVEVGHMSQDKQDKGHMRVMDMLPKGQIQAHNDWDPSGAVECILAKVRDLPAQLTSFMKAVEGRLQKIEERLDTVEAQAAASRASESQKDLASEVKHQMDTMQARLLLLENRVTLIESKSSSSLCPEGVRTIGAMEDKKADFTPGPFVSLERGEDIFSGSLVNTFSPIRQDGGDLNPCGNDTLGSIGEADRRLSSTPNQSGSGRPPAHSSSSTVDREKRPAVSANTTLAWDTLDTSTQQQVARIRDMFKATQLLLPTTGGQQPVDT